MFEERLNNYSVWPARSPDLNPCDFYLSENLKDKLHPNIDHTLLDELKKNY
jgi:hypothetical protein